MKALRRALARIDIDRRDLVLVTGLGLLGCGAGLAWEPIGLALPGAVLTYIAIFGVRG